MPSKPAYICIGMPPHLSLAVGEFQKVSCNQLWDTNEFIHLTLATLESNLLHALLLLVLP